MAVPTDPNFAAIHDKLGELDVRLESVEGRLEPLQNIQTLLEGMAKDQRLATDALLKIARFVPEIDELRLRLARIEATVFPDKH